MQHGYRRLGERMEWSLLIAQHLSILRIRLLWPMNHFTVMIKQVFLPSRFDISKLEPLVAKPHSSDNLALPRECKDAKIERVYIGSCTGEKTEDFLAAAIVFLASVRAILNVTYFYCYFTIH
ncbi:3-isopropylmalate dehydratase large subunit-like [Melia azedarach]|uniref:3-isopropylmalate dehydratase large subunit-like n=1 Tax=Melia azedarach TaxID=155640 RepID=A0ACC1YDB1_MELAZ|nr:3-isopropylmalate dehydratase large subunit-like [Melia azedarach]